MVKTVEFNTKRSNPFYGMKNTLELYQSASKGMKPTVSKLEAAWSECKSTEQLSVLVAVLFFVGDVTSRQHNIFDGKVVEGKISVGGINVGKAECKDMDVFVGIRPEGFEIVEKSSFKLTVYQVETIGRDTTLLVKQNKDDTIQIRILSLHLCYPNNYNMSCI